MWRFLLSLSSGRVMFQVAATLLLFQQLHFCHFRVLSWKMIRHRVVFSVVCRDSEMDGCGYTFLVTLERSCRKTSGCSQQILSLGLTRRNPFPVIQFRVYCLWMLWFAFLLKQLKMVTLLYKPGSEWKSIWNAIVHVASRGHQQEWFAEYGSAPPHVGWPRSSMFPLSTSAGYS